jgi:hypothetical protein
VGLQVCIGFSATRHVFLEIPSWNKTGGIISHLDIGDAPLKKANHRKEPYGSLSTDGLLDLLYGLIGRLSNVAFCCGASNSALKAGMTP